MDEADEITPLVAMPHRGRGGAGHQSTRPCPGLASSLCHGHRPPTAPPGRQGRRWRPPATVAAASFEPLLGHGIRLLMPWAWCAPLAAEAVEIRPAQLHPDRPTETPAPPRRDRPPDPVLSFWRWTTDGCCQLRQQLRRERRRCPMRVRVAAIAHRLGPVHVVAAHH
jgi:hypothetical protein